MARQRRAQDGEPTTGQTLPQDVEAEALILSYLFYDPEGMPTRLFDTLHLLPADMYREQHRVLLQAIHTLHTQGEAPYVQVVVEELRESGKLDDAGGQPAISTLCDLVTQLPSPQEGQADALAKRVRELAVQRTSLSLASAYAQAVYRGDWNAAPTLLVRIDEIAAGVHGQTSHFRLLTDEEVEQLPRPAMLVSNVLVANT